ncbi:MAG: DUF721 domain-containing protein [Spirochaetales bacterium]|nr:DUF721 domain-containing protein [Spirochaetales bacterium]
MERAGDLLKNVFKGSLSQEGRRYSSFFKSWERILGKELAGNVKLIDIKKDILLVTASHPGWMQMVYMKRKKLLALINKLYPELSIKKIKISLASGGRENIQAGTKESQEKEHVENDPASEIDLKKELKTLENSELKYILKKLYTSIQRRR